MTKPTIKKPVYERQFTIVAAGAPRTEAELRVEVRRALAEALQESGEKSGLTAKTEPHGGFLGIGAEWIWFVHMLPTAKAAADAVILGGLGKAGGKLFDVFLEKLRRRNIIAKAAPETKAVSIKDISTEKAKATDHKSSDNRQKNRTRSSRPKR